MPSEFNLNEKFNEYLKTHGLELYNDDCKLLKNAFSAQCNAITREANNSIRTKLSLRKTQLIAF